MNAMNVVHSMIVVEAVSIAEPVTSVTGFLLDARIVDSSNFDPVFRFLLLVTDGTFRVIGSLDYNVRAKSNASNLVVPAGAMAGAPVRG
jgi:hypothetical protein